MKTDEHSLAKIYLTESFLIFLTSHIDVSATTSHVTSMKPIRQKVIEIWINLMQRSLEIASTVLADGNVTQALTVVDGSLKHRDQVEKQVKAIS
jgi:tryptophan 2,3-dioxygenase